MISLTQAILLGFWAWVARAMVPSTHSFWNGLITSAYVGLVLGDIPTAVSVGATLEMVYLGVATSAGVGGVSINDELSAFLFSVSAVVATGLDAGAATAIAVPVGLMYAQINNFKQVFHSVYVRVADKAVAKADAKGLYIASFLLPSFSNIILYWIPLTLMIYYGAPFISSFVDAIPAWLLAGFQTVGHTMPAVGIGIIMYSMGSTKMIPFMLAGFFLVQYSGLGTVGATICGLFIAFLYYLLKIDKGEEGKAAAAETVEVERVLTKKDRLKTMILWFTYSVKCESWERKQGLAFGAALTPCLKKLYGDNKEALAEAMTRETQFFNTETSWGAVIPGIVLSMEEQKALGKNITPDAITAIKAGLMGPMAGIGDSINRPLVYMLLVSLCIPGAEAGNGFIAILPPILFAVYGFIVAYYTFNLGYNTGTKSATSLLKDNKLTQLMPVLIILGMFMAGVLGANYVTVTTPIVITTGIKEFTIQNIFNAIAPGLLPLLTIFFTYYITKKYKNFLATAMIILVASLLLGCIGILA